VWLWYESVWLKLREGMAKSACKCGSRGEICNCLPIPPYAVYSIGSGQPENLLDYVSTLQEELVQTIVLPEDYEFEGHREIGIKIGNVSVTYVDSEKLERDYGFRPEIGIREGLRQFSQWYAEYYTGM
jgi:nucleoside-diphosphate-sugar epimerase